MLHCKSAWLSSTGLLIPPPLHFNHSPSAQLPMRFTEEDNYALHRRLISRTYVDYIFFFYRISILDPTSNTSLDLQSIPHGHLNLEQLKSKCLLFSLTPMAFGHVRDSSFSNLYNQELGHIVVKFAFICLPRGYKRNEAKSFSKPRF